MLAADLSGEGQNASIAALLPDGMRAATVSINAVSGVAGFVKPNDTVDVLITRQAIGTGSGEQVTDVLLQNIRVIAMDQDAAGANGAPIVSRTATVEVTPVDAQKLVLGSQLGSLSLVLRKPGEEQNIPQVDTVSLDDLRYSYFSGQRPVMGGSPVAGAAPGTARNVSMMAPPIERRARVARLTQPQRAPVKRRVTAPVGPSTSTISVTRGTQTSNYEVGGYAR